MDQWQSLLERFLRHECSGRESKIIYHALRDGLIDDEFRCAIDAVMSDLNAMADSNYMEPLPDDLLDNIRSRMKKKKVNFIGQRNLIREWLKIAVAVAVTLFVSWQVFHTKRQEEPPTFMNTITVPAGQTVALTLADGTNIWLNARTMMKYPSMFTGNKREIILEGEGFFDVAHDPEKPFVVHAGGYNIQALGTQFNVEAYSQDTDFSTSLLEGSVRVISATDSSQAIILQPNTMARLHEGRLISKVITDFDHYRWHEGLICFKNMPFTDLMTKFEKCYGIKIIIQNNLVKNYAPTGKFRHSDGIDYALRVLQRDLSFGYERNEENHIIYIK